MKKQYNESRLAYNRTSEARKPATRIRANEMLIYWPNRNNRIYMTANQARNLVLAMKDPEAD
jgi:hypothetical protein